MTVRELIALLKNFDPSTEVHIPDIDCTTPANCVRRTIVEGNKVIVISYDVDMDY